MFPRSWKAVLLTFSLGLSATVLISSLPASSQTRVCAQDDRIFKVPGVGHHPSVVGDYIVLFFDAAAHQTAWYGYSPTDGQARPILRNASLFPIVYSKEKMAVHVCGLHFGDTLTVSTNPVGVIEGGADFRGVTPNAAPALQSTADALSGSGTTGGSVPAGSLGLGSPAPIGSLVLNGITPGSNGGKTTGATPDAYTDATISISPQQLALAMRAYMKNAGAVCSTIQELMTGESAKDSDSRGTPCIASSSEPIKCPQDGFRGLPGSISYLQDESICLVEDLTNMQKKVKPGYESPAAFDEYEAKVQAFIGELSGLNSTLNSDALGPRAIALQQNYATIEGILGVVRNTIAADHNLHCTDQPEQCPADTNCSPTATTDKNGKLVCSPPKKTPSGAQCPPVTPVATGDTVKCHYSEEVAFINFLSAYESGLRIEDDTNVERDTNEIKPGEVFGELKQLHDQLQALATQTGRIFKIMNRWYEDSNVEDNDLLTPVAGNALMRINIIVQRTYVPFTFAGSPAPGGSPAAGGAAGAPSAAGGSPGGGGGTQAGGAAASAAGAGGAGSTAGGAGGGGASVASAGGAGGGGSAGATTTPAHTVETVLVEVHRRANFNIVGGAMVIRVPTKSFGVQPGIATSLGSGTYSASCNGGSPQTIAMASFYCATVTQTSDWQVAGMAGVAWFPLLGGRDYFPRGTSGSLHWRNLAPALLVATSVTSLGNAFVGPDFEPVNGLDLYVGIASAHQTALPSSQSLTAVLLPSGNGNNPPTLQTATHVKAGLTFGVGFDLSVFTQIFSKTSSAGLP